MKQKHILAAAGLFALVSLLIPMSARAELPAADPSNGVSILEARYGAFHGWVDMTEQVQSQVKDGRLHLPTLAPIFKGVPDPAFGHYKQLVIVYRHDGEVRMKIHPAGQKDLILPENGPHKLPTVRVWLSDLSPVWVSTFTDHSWGFGTRGFFGGRFDGELEKIQINGKSFEHSLGTHPRTGDGGRVIYEVGGRFSRFAGSVGITDQPGLCHTPLTFEIVGDQKSLWRSGPVQKSGELTGFDIGVGGVRRLELVVHCPGSNHAAAAVWIEPRLQPAGAGATAASLKAAVKTVSMKTANPQLLVAGSGSHNIVRFDLKTGESTVVARLANGSRPRSIAVNKEGEIFVGLRGNAKNIVKLVPHRASDPDGPLVAQKLTGQIGRFGPGLMAFDQRGLLSVAGDTHRGVMRFDVKTGKLVEMMRLRAANLVGMTLSGNDVYAAEYFQRTVLRFNLESDPAQGSKFIYKSELLNRPHGMTIGHNGNLFVSNLLNARIEQFSGEDGKHIGGFLDVRSLGGGNVNDLHYEPTLDRYYITSGNTVFEVARNGSLLSRLESGSLHKAEAVAVIPAPGATPKTEPAPQSTNLRLRVYLGDPSNRKASRAVLDKPVTTGKPFGFEAGFTLRVSGLVTQDKSGQLHFKGRVTHNAGALEYDSNAKPGEAIRASGGLVSGGVLPFFVQFNPLPDEDSASSQPPSESLEEKRLSELGAKLKTEDGKIVEVDLTNSKITDTGLELLSSLTSLKVLSLAGCDHVTDAGLVYLRNLKELQTLNLGPSNISDDGLKHLSGLKNLEILNLSGTKIGDAGLSHLAGLKKISVLYLAHTRTTSDGLKTIQGMPELQWLDLKDTRVSDDGLQHLSGLKRLRLLGLVGCGISEAGLKRDFCRFSAVNPETDVA